MKYVLDTNLISEIMRGDARALARLEQVGRSAVVVPQPVFAEIAYGIARLPRSRRKRDLQTIYGRLLQELNRVVWTDEASARFGEKKALLEKRGERLEDFDLAIAAHALAEGHVLATANTKHMRRIPGLTVEDWLNED